MSDASFKTNLTPIEAPIEKLNGLKTYRYDVINRYFSEDGDSLQNTLAQYGFISQEIEQALPEVKITEDGKDGKLMDYDQIIPLLVAAVQEQLKQIEGYEMLMSKMMATSDNTSSKSTNSSSNNIQVSSLTNNIPNPFNLSTDIHYYLDVNASKAEIKIWTMDGVLIKTFNLNVQQGNNHVTLNSSEIPNHGTYVYSLIVNNVIVDAKTMVYN